MLTINDFKEAAKKINVDYRYILAIAQKEAPNSTGFNKDGTPVILFERHKFSQKTGGIYDKKYPNISNKVAGGYGKYSDQHARLQQAVALDRSAALESASWGRFQIMGENWRDLGYKTLQEFINAMYKSEAAQLDAFIRFIKFKKIDVYMRAGNFQEIARLYNGSKYKINNYDADLQKIFNSL